MDGKLYIFFLLIIERKWTCCLSVSVSGVIFDDVTFIHQTFPVQPSIRAIIKVDVHYEMDGERPCPILGIYTTEDHINIDKKCTETQYGQVWNRDLHPVLTVNRNDSAPLSCEADSTNRIHCSGIISVLDFIPRTYSFSFGHFCSFNNSLEGLAYNMSIYGQTNRTACFELNRHNVCHEYFQYASILNPKDDVTAQSHREIREVNTASCYQHSLELLCYVSVPKCNPVTKRIIPACREMRQDCVEGCRTHEGNWTQLNCDYLPPLGSGVPCFYKSVQCKEPAIVNNSTFVTNFTKIGDNFLYNTVEYSCNEGFKLEGKKTIKCLRSGLWSQAPNCVITKTPLINFTTEPTTEFITESTTESEFESTVQLSTESRTESTFESAAQSNPSNRSGLLFIVPPILFVLLVILLCIVRYVTKRKANKIIGVNRQPAQPEDSLTQLDEHTHADTASPNDTVTQIDLVTNSHTVPPLRRNRSFDAYVLYNFDSDNDFVMNYLLPELEETRDFKLCIHRRNFTPGRDIKDNIEEAIDGSNSAIIVMSQGFVDSIWCKEEFTHCYIENMKDPAFNMFVIMMQPADTLVNISNYMKTFFANKTYLDVNDAELYTKLGKQKEIARQADNGNVDSERRTSIEIEIRL